MTHSLFFSLAPLPIFAACDIYPDIGGDGEREYLADAENRLEKPELGAKLNSLEDSIFDLLYDLTSTYFEGEAVGVKSAARGYSRDHRPNCLQIVIALIVTTEGLPLSHEVFSGNRLDVTTLKEILETVEKKYGQAKRVWVFDRGIVSEENLRLLRERGALYLVGTPRRQLKAYEKQLLEGGWEKASREVEVKLIAEQDEAYVVCRSQARRAKEKAMRWRALRALRRRVSRGRRCAHPTGYRAAS